MSVIKEHNTNDVICGKKYRADFFTKEPFLSMLK